MITAGVFEGKDEESVVVVQFEKGSPQRRERGRDDAEIKEKSGGKPAFPTFETFLLK